MNPRDMRTWKKARKATCLLGAVACLLGAGRVAAQEAGGKSSEAVEVRLLAVELLDGGETLVLRSGEVTTEAVEVPTHGLSDPLRVPARRLAIATPGDVETPGRGLGEATLPDNGRRFLLLLIPSKERYLCRVVALDDPAFRPGHVCFLNVSAVPVGGRLGSGEFVAQPGKPQLVAPPRRQDLPYYQMSLFYQQGEESRALADTRWPHDERCRSYVFIYPNPRSGRLTYRAVDEELAVE